LLPAFRLWRWPLQANSHFSQTLNTLGRLPPPRRQQLLPVMRCWSQRIKHPWLPQPPNSRSPMGWNFSPISSELLRAYTLRQSLPRRHLLGRTFQSAPTPFLEKGQSLGKTFLYLPIVLFMREWKLARIARFTPTV